MRKKFNANLSCLLLLISSTTLQAATDQTKPFLHPGGLHTQTELDRAKSHVAAGQHPWIDSWNALLNDPKAQLTYKPAPQANIGASRQRASADAVAIYLNAIRGYISGDKAYTDHAIQMCNAWSAAANQIPSGADQPGLNGIFTYEFAVDAEILCMYVGTQWAQDDFDRFKKMMRTYLYPPCHDFLLNHDNTCITHCWTNWDACCITAIGSIGVLCDDRPLFDEAVDYFKNGDGNGSIKNAVYFVHPGNLGQWQETGRDQEHAQLGIGLLASFCQIAQHQGLDLFAYDNNRLLAGAEYTAKFTLWQDVPFKFYNNCDDVNQYWPSRQGRGRLQRPIWEQLYNEYVVRRGLTAPSLTTIAALNRPEAYTHDDNFGYGTLLYTLNASAYPPFPIPQAPKDLTTTPGVDRVYLHWTPPSTANGFTINRSTTPNGPYTQLTKYRGIIPEFSDTKVTNGTTYYYTVAADNQSGASPDSSPASATPIPATNQLPLAWSHQDIGPTSKPGSAQYAPVNDNTFIIKGAASSIGGKEDAMSLATTPATGNTLLTARLIDCNLHSAGKWSRIGIVMRASLDPGAPTAALLLGDLGYREAHFGTREKTAAPMSFIPGNAYTAPSQFPTWFRLQRIGKTFTAYQSSDGKQWFKVGSSTISMPNKFLTGIAVSADNTESITLTCDHVSSQSTP